MAEALAAAGATVAVLGRSERTDEAARALGGLAVHADLSDRAELRRGFDDAVHALGGLDVLVTSHGIGRPAEALEHGLDDWDEVLEVNLTSVFRLCQLAGRIMVEQRRGKIVNVASMLSFSGGLKVSSYAASKGGVAQLTKALANEWAPLGVNVNAIAPGYVKTEPQRTHLARRPGAHGRDPGADPGGPLGRARRPRRRRRLSRLCRVGLPARRHPPGRRRLARTLRPVPVETSIFAFATDLADEGLETVLDNVQHRAGLAGVTIAAAYHEGRDLFPHNPRHKVRFLEGGAVFFPTSERWRGVRLRPPVSEVAHILPELVAAAAARDLSVHAWTVFLHNGAVAAEHPDCAPENAFGDRYVTDLCPANPDVRAFAVALAAEVAHLGVTSINAESLHFHALEHGYAHERYFVPLGPVERYLLGLCFCRHCLGAAHRHGVDGQAVRRFARAEPRALRGRRRATDRAGPHAARDGRRRRAGRLSRGAGRRRSRRSSPRSPARRGPRERGSSSSTSLVRSRGTRPGDPRARRHRRSPGSRASRSPPSRPPATGSRRSGMRRNPVAFETTSRPTAMPRSR